MVNCYQFWPERRVKRMPCPLFWSYFTCVLPKFPTWTEVINQNLHQTHATNVKLAFPDVATTICYQLLHDGGGWKGITSSVLVIFHLLLHPTVVWCNWPTTICTEHALQFVLGVFRNVWHWTCSFYADMDKQQSCLVCLDTPATTASATTLTLTLWVKIILSSLSFADCLERPCHWGHVSPQRSGLRSGLLADCSVNKIPLGMRVCLWTSVCGRYETLVLMVIILIVLRPGEIVSEN